MPPAAKQFSFRGKTVDPFAEPERMTVAEAFERHAGVDLLATVNGGQGDRDMLAAAATKVGVKIAADDTWGDIFSRILAERVDPHLGIGRATLLYEYPLPLAALARAKPGSNKVAERFELYACGVELANAFGELTDVAEQRARFEAAMAEKQRIHGERYPVDEDFLAALGVMPPASGIALGFDRLVMLATGAQRIEQVIWTPVVEPVNEVRRGTNDADSSHCRADLRSRFCAARTSARAESGCRALCGGAAAGARRFDRPK